MQDCHKDIFAFHNERVTLGNKDRAEMRDRRDKNRTQTRSGLKAAGQPEPSDFKSQGSYAMWTMVKDPDKDYDIDDGVYFTKESLVGPHAGDKTALDAKKMVRDAVDDKRFKTPPEVRKNCVRVYYQAGYHVDLPVYREIVDSDRDESYYELAGTDWKRSDPQSVTEWLRNEDKRQSPASEGSVGQLRRLVRILKRFARSRKSWRDRIASGFMITVLVVEEYRKVEGREDLALYDTMVAIRDRLCRNLQIRHPTVPGETLTKGSDDAQAKFFRAKLEWAVDRLSTVASGGCTRREALDAWDAVFDTEFFSERLGDEDSKSKFTGGSLATPLIRTDRDSTPRRVVDKRGGGRYA